MPENFCLIENYEAVAKFLIELRHKLNIAGQAPQRVSTRFRTRGQLA
jgi:hypothetical protein